MDYNLKIIRSGSMMEIYYYNNYVVKSAKVKSNNSVNCSKDNKEHCRKYYLSTIRSNIIRIVNCNANAFKSFITLTYSFNVSEEENTKYLNLFFTKLRRKYRNLSYIWCLERTKKGRIHIHMLTNIEFKYCNTSSDRRKSNAHKSEENEFENTYWTYDGKVLGFLDIRSIEDSVKYAKYIVKYMTKDNNDIVSTNKHIWGCSKNLSKPYKEVFLTKQTLEEVLQNFKDFKIEYSSNYNIEIAYDSEVVVSYFNMNIERK